MGDIVSKDTRSKMMSSIRSVSKLEDKISKELWSRGIRFRRNSKKLFGRPDWSIKKYKIVIFLDSCFWHGCEIHGNMPKSNSDFWKEKLERNKARDREVTNYYKERNWNILRIWEHETKKDFKGVIDKIERFINKAKNSTDY